MESTVVRLEWREAKFERIDILRDFLLRERGVSQAQQRKGWAILFCPGESAATTFRQNLLTRTRELVGDRDPDQHEFNVQLRSYDTTRSGAYLGVAALLAFCSSILGKSLKGD